MFTKCKHSYKYYNSNCMNVIVMFLFIIKCTLLIVLLLYCCSLLRACDCIHYRYVLMTINNDMILQLRSTTEVKGTA